MEGAPMRGSTRKLHTQYQARLGYRGRGEKRGGELPPACHRGLQREDGHCNFAPVSGDRLKSSKPSLKPSMGGSMVSLWEAPAHGGSGTALPGLGRGEVYSDRFIPSRTGSSLSLINDENAEDMSCVSGSGSASTDAGTNDSGTASASQGSSEGLKEGQAVLNTLLRKELLGSGVCGASRGLSETSQTNMFRFKAPRRKRQQAFGLSSLPAISSSPQIVKAQKNKRKVPKVPFKVLDAPQLQDDFYLNLVDWSGGNILAVGLGSCVYLWSACTSKVTKLCDLGPDDCVTSVAWTQRGTHLAVGTNSGDIEVWEASRCKRIRTMTGHSARVSSMSWSSHVLASGSRDRLIFLRDVRVARQHISTLAGHKQEVCGLRWSFDDSQLASGGNDNKLCIWNAHSTSPIVRFNEHTAAIKALAWSPHQHGLLASGGGTADRCIRFWNTLTSTPLHCVDTSSQVCNLVWSKNVNEIVSTHGYSLNQVVVWKYPTMTKVATLTGHTYRVLYLSVSPDGQTIVTGAGDETLRFWSLGTTPRAGSRLGTSLLFPAGSDIR
ncbi:unnamed protein product [Chrysoparadoxa australica]